MSDLRSELITRQKHCDLCKRIVDLDEYLYECGKYTYPYWVGLICIDCFKRLSAGSK